MIQNLATSGPATTKRERRIAMAAAQAPARHASPVFADVNRFAEPSATRMVWMPTTTGQHPSFV